MKKRIIAFFLAVIMLCTLMPVSAFAESGKCGENLTYSYSSGTLTISGTGAMKDYTSYSAVPWHSIASSIKSVIIKSGVTSIGEFAFYNCRSLESVTIPSSVTSIGDCTFEYCSSLESVTIPNSVKSIGEFAFYSCSSLTSVTIPNSVKSIGDCAFDSCSSLTSVTIPNSVTSIGRSAFADCDRLTSVTIPNSVKSIGEFAFYSCSSLTSVTIPNSVKSIGDCAFEDCDRLTNVTIPSSVTSIGAWAFGNCSSLTSVTIPSSVTSIGRSAFFSCSSLTSVTIPNSVTSIGDAAFKYCSKLTDVYYRGTETKWKEIAIGEANECLTNAKIHYNGAEPTLTPSISAKTASIYIGGTKTLSVKNAPAGAKITWSSGDTAIAAVSSSGTVTAKKAGTATITAAVKSGDTTEKLSCTVTVKTPTVTLSKSSLSIYNGSCSTLTATTAPSGYKVTWSSSNTSVATVSSSGKVTTKKVGTATITASFKYKDKTYKKTCKVTVKTKPTSLNSSKTKLTLSKTSYTYSGKYFKPTVTVTYNSKKLTKDTDYTVSYKNHKNAGTATVTVSGCGKYTDSVSKTFKIAKADSSISLKNSTKGYAGYALSISKATVKGSSGAVTYTYYTDSDCKIKTDTSASKGGAASAGKAPVNAGTYYVKAKVAADSNYNAATSAKAKLVIEPVSISGASASLSTSTYTYSGSAKKPTVTVKLGKKTLKKDSDYTVSYSDNTAAGTATVSIKGKGNYTGNLKKTFTIKKLSISSAKITLEKISYSSDGAAKKPVVQSVKVGSTTLKASDYSVTYTSDKYSGEGTITVKGKGSCTGSAGIKYLLNKKTLSPAVVSLKTKSYTYDGKAKKPAVSVVILGKELVKNTDYTVSYQNNTNVGTATVKVTGKGSYKGSVSLNFTINKATPTITLSSKDAVYTGKAVSIGKAQTNSSGSISYTYYKDAACKNKTTTADGASKDGAAPAKMGTYYVKAKVAETSSYKSATSAAATLKIYGTYVNDLPAWCLGHYDLLDANGNYNEDYEFIPIGGVAYDNKGHVRIASFNTVAGDISCTMFTMHKLRLRDLGFPFAKGANLNGAGWYAGCIDSWVDDNNVTHNIVKEKGGNALENLWNKYSSKYEYLENIVVSYSSNSSTDANLKACGHVMLIDKLYKDESTGKLMVQYSDNGNNTSPKVYSPLMLDTFLSKDYSKILHTETLDAYKSFYVGYNGPITGVVLIGASK